VTRRQLTLGLAAVSVRTARASESIEVFGHKWTVPVAADWKIESANGVPSLRLLVARPMTAPRRPVQFALAETPDLAQVEFEVEVRKEPFAARNRRTSLIFAYAFRDPDHFNYVHLSVDSAALSAHHNGVFHVYGGERVRISPIDGPGSLREDAWQIVRLHFDGSAGKVRVWVDGQTSPSLTATDESLRAGRVGMGSFFDYGEFRKFRIIRSVAA
jgi:hypothetical protein